MSTSAASATSVTPKLITLLPLLSPHIVLKIPGGQRVQVFVGTAFILGVSAIPVLYKPQKRGHDLFSQEKPQAVEERQQELKQQYRQARKQEQTEQPKV
jgi:hypothetical protein